MDKNEQHKDTLLSVTSEMKIKNNLPVGEKTNILLVFSPDGSHSGSQ